MTTSRALAWLVIYHSLVSQTSGLLIGLNGHRGGTRAQVPTVHHPISLYFTFYCPLPVTWTPRLDLLGPTLLFAVNGLKVTTSSIEKNKKKMLETALKTRKADIRSEYK